MKDNELTVKMNEWDKFQDEQVESLDCSDHFDSGFRVAMSIASDWLHEKILEQKTNNPSIRCTICHVCGAKMDYTEEYETTFNVKDEYVFIDRIRAYICPNCGEIVYNSDEARRIENIVHRRNVLDF
jgi:YgiT-type zinc finger domain-containing protein